METHEKIKDNPDEPIPVNIISISCNGKLYLGGVIINININVERKVSDIENEETQYLCHGCRAAASVENGSFSPLCVFNGWFFSSVSF